MRSAVNAVKLMGSEEELFDLTPPPQKNKTNP